MREKGKEGERRRALPVQTAHSAPAHLVLLAKVFRGFQNTEE